MLVIFENEAKVILPQLLLTQLKEHLQTVGFQKESGGIILGSKKTHQSTYIINELTFPDRRDRRFPRALFVHKKSKRSNSTCLAKFIRIHKLPGRMAYTQ